MPDKTIAIVGAGPGLGFSLAKRFGREGFRVAQIARNRETLAGLTADLANRGIIAEGFADEVTQGETIRQAFREIERRLARSTCLNRARSTYPRIRRATRRSALPR